MHDLHTPTAAAVAATDWSRFDASLLDIGRSTIRPDVRVMTSWLPTYGHAETLVDAPEHLVRALALEGYDTVTYAHRTDALAGHAEIVRRLTDLVDAEAA